mmetsp:Transcript_2482/g.5920  ORF Transcript_2482/g.5920 Transcript_2482/m.5920 type:complete len:437 (-) Transcript_2482:2829-4139(-)
MPRAILVPPRVGDPIASAAAAVVTSTDPAGVQLDTAERHQIAADIHLGERVEVECGDGEDDNIVEDVYKLDVGEAPAPAAAVQRRPERREAHAGGRGNGEVDGLEDGSLDLDRLLRQVGQQRDGIGRAEGAQVEGEERPLPGRERELVGEGVVEDSEHDLVALVAPLELRGEAVRNARRHRRQPLRLRHPAVGGEEAGGDAGGVEEEAGGADDDREGVDVRLRDRQRRERCHAPQDAPPQRLRCRQLDRSQTIARGGGGGRAGSSPSGSSAGDVEGMEDAGQRRRQHRHSLLHVERHVTQVVPVGVDTAGEDVGGVAGQLEVELLRPLQDLRDDRHLRVESLGGRDQGEVRLNQVEEELAAVRLPLLQGPRAAGGRGGGEAGRDAVHEHGEVGELDLDCLHVSDAEEREDAGGEGRVEHGSERGGREGGRRDSHGP